MSNEIEQKMNALVDALRTEEQKEKRRYDDAIDIEDMTKAKEVMLDARAKIQQLRKWAESLIVLQAEITDAYLASKIAAPPPAEVVTESRVKNESESVITETVWTSEPEQNTEDTQYSSAGEYVRQKLYQLSRSGFVFSDEQLRNIQDSIWSRKVLNLPHQFARIYDCTKDILKQTSIAGMPRRYWVKDRFEFGDVTLLIYSGWAPVYLPYFDAWYDSLNQQIDKANDIQQASEPSLESIVEYQPLEEPVSEQVKVGYYIRTKLRELCDAGYKPTEHELLQWQDKYWSKQVLNLNYPFVRLLSEKNHLAEQTSDENSRNRYWAEVFQLGTISLLFCSQWYRPDKEYFDRWYDGLKTQAEVKTSPIPLAVEEPLRAILDNDVQEETRSELDEAIALIPTSFTLLEKTYEANGWDDVLVKLCEAMILKKPYKALAMGAKQSVQSGGIPVLWLDERGESHESYRLSNGMSVVKSKSSGEIKSYCERILNLCGYDHTELIIN